MKKTKAILLTLALATTAVPATTGLILSNESAVVEAATSGWGHDSKGWYYRKEDGTYIMSDWLQDKGKWYFFNKDGYMLTGWAEMKMKWYYFGTDGAMVTGVQTINGKIYGFTQSGVMKKNDWLSYNKKWYYFGSDGVACTGFKTIKDAAGNRKFYFNSKGVLQTGWISIKNGDKTDKYYAYPKGYVYRDDVLEGEIATGLTYIRDEDDMDMEYYFGTDGKMQTEWLNISDGWEDLFGKYNTDKTTGAVLDQKELAAVTELNLMNRDFYADWVFELFKNLKTLDCQGNHLTNLDVSKNTKLTSLSCSNNPLKTLKIGKGLTYINAIPKIENATFVKWVDAKGVTYTEKKMKEVEEVTELTAVYKCTTHAWDSGKITKEATCAEEGTKLYKCRVCGEKMEVAIPTTEHTIVYDMAVAPTVTKTGLTEGYHCSVCKKVITAQKVVDALGGWYKNPKNGKYYFYNKKGKYITGWKKYKGDWYYLSLKDGTMQTGWKCIEGGWYFFKKNGVMAADEYYNGYRFNKDGTCTYESRAYWKKDKTGWWYGDKTGWYAKDCTLKINDVDYVFDKNGYCIE